MNLTKKQRQLLYAMQQRPGHWWPSIDVLKNGILFARDVEPLEHDRLITRRTVSGTTHFGLTVKGRNVETVL